MTKTNIAVGIILINYKNPQDTLECLESIESNSFTDYRVVVVDNCSSDNSAHNIKEWINAKNQFFLVEAPENLGFSGGNNLGADYLSTLCNCDYLWFLNNDTVIDKDALSSLVKTAKDHPEAGAIGSKILRYDQPDTLQCLGGCAMNPWYPVPIPYLGGEKDASFDDQEMTGSISGASFFIRTHVFVQIGRWDERFFLQVEEDDLSIRIKQAGHKLFISGNSEIYHKEGASLKRKIIIKRFLWEKTKRVSFESFFIHGYYDFRNRIYLAKKHYNFIQQAWYFLIFLPLFFLANILCILIHDDRKIDRIKILLRGLKDGLIKKMGGCNLDK